MRSNALRGSGAIFAGSIIMLFCRHVAAGCYKWAQVLGGTKAIHLHGVTAPWQAEVATRLVSPAGQCTG